MTKQQIIKWADQRLQLVKLRLIVLFLLTIGLVCSQLPLLTHADNGGVILSTDDNYPPISSKRLAGGGMGVQIVLRSLEISNFPVKEIKWQPWARGYKLTQIGAIDGAFPWGPTPERLNQFYFSKPILHITNYAYVNVKTGYAVHSFDDLKNRIYCNPNGYGDFGIIAQYRKEGILRREEPLSMPLCFKMLALGRVDMVIAPKWDANFAIKISGEDPGLFRREEIAIAHTPLCLISALSNPKGKALIDAFNKGLSVLKETGELEALHRQFNFEMYRE